MKTSYPASLGLSYRELRDFSFQRAICALLEPSNRRLQENARFEFEVSAAAQRGSARPLEGPGLRIPAEILEFAGKTRVVQNTGSAAAGGNLVATNLLAGSFIELLRKASRVQEAGATMLTGLVGNVAIPRMTGSTTAYWVAENDTPTASAATFDQVTLSPKTVGAYVDMSRRTILQTTPAIENILREDLAKVLATEIDRVALHGSGASNQPTGVAATSGIGSVAGGTNGLAPTWAHVVALETAIANSNADGGKCAYITNSRVRAKLKQTLKNPSATDAGYIIAADKPDSMNGNPLLVTNQVSNVLTKGSSTSVCSAIFFGDWSQLVIGSWGNGLDLLVDPYTGSAAGTVRIRVLQDVDIGVRHAEAFAAMLDALTV